MKMKPDKSKFEPKKSDIFGYHLQILVLSSRLCSDILLKVKFWVIISSASENFNMLSCFKTIPSLE